MLEIVVPIYKPVKGWQNILKNRIGGLQELFSEEIRLVLIDDGSQELQVTEGIEYLKQEFNVTSKSFSSNRGKGQSLRDGLKMTKNKRVITTDVDFPFSDQSYLAIIQALDEGADVVLGKRNRQYQQNLPWMRKVLSSLFTRISSRLTKSPGDSQAGLKGLNRIGVQKFLETETNRYLADFEFVNLAVKGQLIIQVVPVEVVYHKSTRLGVKAFLREMINFFRILMKI